MRRDVLDTFFIGRWDGEMDGEVSVVVMRNVDMGPGRVLVQNLKS